LIFSIIPSVISKRPTRVTLREEILDYTIKNVGAKCKRKNLTQIVEVMVRKIDTARDKDDRIERRKVMSEVYSGWVKNVVKPQSGDGNKKRG